MGSSYAAQENILGPQKSRRLPVSPQQKTKQHHQTQLKSFEE
ncbi:hypothetical protein MTO96_038647, partial [Rhipicephalus appendiculatus]